MVSSEAFQGQTEAIEVWNRACTFNALLRVHSWVSRRLDDEYFSATADTMEGPSISQSSLKEQN